jgi:hypothetical protein
VLVLLDAQYGYAFSRTKRAFAIYRLHRQSTSQFNRFAEPLHRELYAIWRLNYS